jgi:hypothetical protein
MFPVWKSKTPSMPNNELCNVFSNIVLKTNGRNCIHDECDSMEAQKVYAAILKA